MPDERTGCSHVPARFRDRYLDSFDPSVGKAADLALRAVQQLAAGEIPMVLLSGPPGSGKTHLAAAACNELASRIHVELVEAEVAERLDADDPTVQRNVSRARYRSVRACPVWVTVPQLLGNLRRAMGQTGSQANADVVEAMDAAGVVVLDDLGAEKASEWTGAALFEIVGPRYDTKLPMLVTSNWTADELARAGYDRIISRLQDGGALVEMASAIDFRSRLRRSVA